MTIIRRVVGADINIPARTAWYLSDLGEYKGRQALLSNCEPQRLKALREHAIIESSVLSNRRGDVSIDPDRLGAVLIASRPMNSRGVWPHGNFLTKRKSALDVRVYVSTILDVVYGPVAVNVRDSPEAAQKPTSPSRLPPTEMPSVGTLSVAATA